MKKAKLVLVELQKKGPFLGAVWLLIDSEMVLFLCYHLPSLAVAVLVVVEDVFGQRFVDLKMPFYY